MRFTPSTEIEKTGITAPGQKKRSAARAFAAFAVAAGFVVTSGVPAYAVSDELDAVSFALRTGQMQALDASSMFTEQPLSSLQLEYVRPVPTTVYGQHPRRQIVDVPAGVGASGVVTAALAQLGVRQDCTDLVQNSLAAVGLTQRRDRGGYDLGTGIWQYDKFGSRVSIDTLAPGDVLVYGNARSGAHVAIYIGNGQAVHGGYSGNTVVAGVHSLRIPLTGAIRVD